MFQKQRSSFLSHIFYPLSPSLLTGGKKGLGLTEEYKASADHYIQWPNLQYSMGHNIHTPPTEEVSVSNQELKFLYRTGFYIYGIVYLRTTVTD